MGKRTEYKDQHRTLNGESYSFEVYEQNDMIHVQGNGDKRSTGKLASGDAGTVIINDLIAELFRRCRIKPVGH
ncbi:hypothetical protein NKH81_15135 [Mesorhizobium sp. M0959]|uniref:hypothetical protein n=1 Tax=unclassified Mesorhizobium TaxID=325217 RepID=UPI003335D5D0